MERLKNWKRQFKALISLCALGALPFVIPVGDVVDLWRSLQIEVLLASGLIIFFSIFLSSVRFSALAKRMGKGVNFRTAHYINILSILYGLLFLNVIGQAISRVSISTSYQLNSSHMVFLTFLEKVVSLISLLALAVAGIYISTISLHVDVNAQEHFLLVIAYIGVLFLALWLFVFQKGQKRYIKSVLLALHVIRLDYTLLTSVLIHLMTLSSYVVIGHYLLPDVPLLIIASAFSIAMLSASLPISIGGWGIRELTAGAVFSALSLDPGVGIAAAIMVGVASIVSLGIHLFISRFLFYPQKPSEEIYKESERQNYHVERAVAYFSGIAIAILVGVQMRVPSGEFLTTINFADPISLLAGLTFVSFWYIGHREQKIWRVPHFNLGIFLFSLAILMGLANGYFTYGSNSWAITNRSFGLIIIFSYLASGALFVALFGRTRSLALLQIMVVASSVTYAGYLVDAKFSLLGDGFAYELFGWSNRQFNGLTLNSNAFSFQILLIFCVLLVAPQNKVIKNRSFLLSIILLLIFASGSRTGLLSGAVVLALSIYMKCINFRQLSRISVFFVCLLGLQWLFVTLHIVTLDGLPQPFRGGNISNISNIMDSNFSRLDPHVDRIASYVGGVKMWLDNLWIGGGLGAFIARQGNHPLVIHNTLIWVLAEMGLIGLAMFIFLPIRTASHIFRNGLQKIAWEDSALILCLVTISIFSLVHEISYQRSMWFIIGLLVANKWQIKLERPSP